MNEKSDSLFSYCVFMPKRSTASCRRQCASRGVARKNPRGDYVMCIADNFSASEVV
jgi:hypothetical protein